MPKPEPKPPPLTARLRALPRMVAAEAEIQAAALRASRAARRLAAKGSGRLIVGPWLSEVGFEVLYWIPFVKWLARRYDLDPEQLVAVTRGGAGAWYGGLCGSSLDIYELYSRSEVKRWHERRVRDTRSQKQMTMSSVEADILGRVRERLGEDAAVLHPSLMYNLFRPFWANRRPISHVDRHSLQVPLPSPRPEGCTHPALAGLPDDYVAVKAYFSSCFPDTEGNRAWLRDLLAQLSERTAVVLLSTGLDVDDHADFEDTSAPRIVSLVDKLDLADNLAVQSEAITGARAVFATYGGFSYLGPFLGVPSYSFYSHANFNPTHLNVMALATRALGAEGVEAGFVAVDVRQARLLQSIYDRSPSSALP
jgi:hypothetical protein